MQIASYMNEHLHNIVHDLERFTTFDAPHPRCRVLPIRTTEETDRAHNSICFRGDTRVFTYMFPVYSFNYNTVRQQLRNGNTRTFAHSSVITTTSGGISE